MKKRAIVSYSSSSIWESCTKIIPNLNSAYQNAFGLETTRHFQLSGKPYENIDLCLEIFNYNPDQLIFTDNRLDPITILENLREYGFYKDHPKEHIIHIYGNPYYRGIQYLLECANRFKDQNFSFRSSSTRFTNLLSSFYGDSPHAINYIPYPIDKDLTHFDKVQRAQVRKGLGLESDDKLIIYAGRISPGKNIQNLLKLFQQLHEKNTKTHFLLIGKFDDYEWENHSGEYNEGRYRTVISQQLLELKISGVRIDHIPHLPFNELKQYFLAADLQMSFSISKGEDFGMSILEGLQTGLPCLISDWGGHTDFKVIGEGVHFLKVNWTIDGIEVDFSHLVSTSIENFLLKDSEREALSVITIQHFSIEKISRLLKDLDLNFSKIANNKLLFMLRNSNIHMTHLQSNEIQRKYYEQFYN